MQGLSFRIEESIMTGINPEYLTRANAEAETPKPSADWLALSQPERVAVVQERITENGWAGVVTCLSADDSGRVIVELAGDFAAAQRGTLLRSLERHLKRIDPALAVYLQPKADKNRLRLLRGVTVK